MILTPASAVITVVLLLLLLLLGNAVDKKADEISALREIVHQRNVVNDALRRDLRFQHARNLDLEAARTDVKHAVREIMHEIGAEFNMLDNTNSIRLDVDGLNGFNSKCLCIPLDQVRLFRSCIERHRTNA